MEWPNLTQALKQARVDVQKVDRFYGTQRGLMKGRTRGMVQTSWRWRLFRLMRRMGL